MNKLYLGDNLKVMQSMDAESVDLIYADPPFNTRKLQGGNYYSWRKPLAATYQNKSDYVRPDNSFSNICEKWHEDHKDSEFYFLSHFCSPSELYYFFDMIPILQEIKRVLKVGGALYWHCDYWTNAVYRIILNTVFGDRGCFRNEIIWHYPNKPPMINLKHRFNNTYNNILFYSKLKDQRFVGYFDLACTDSIGNKKETVWTIPTAKGAERVNYPTQKPIELLLRIIKASSNKNDVVLDPFCGSGTTLDAAESLQRHWIGIDQSKLAIDITRERLEKHVMFLKYDFIEF